MSDDTIKAHAPLAPSGAPRWMRCFASTAMEAGLPDKSSEYATEGTIAHAVAADILDDGMCDLADHPGADEDMADILNGYAKRTFALAHSGRDVPHTLQVEKWVDMRSMIPECYGTSDAIILADDELIVVDLKYGMGERVDAEDNEQLQLYALGAFLANKDHHDYVEPFKQARLIIDQPRLGAPSEWTISIPNLLKFADRAERAAVMNIHYRDKCKTKADIPKSEFNPGVKQCRWCKAFAYCDAAQAKVANLMSAEYEPIPETFGVTQDVTLEVCMSEKSLGGDLTPEARATILGQTVDPLAVLGARMAELEFVEKWCKAIRAAVFAELKQGHEVPGFKLVLGRQGDREWTSESDADKLLTNARLKMDQRYTMKIISPAQAEKLLKKEKPRHWKKAQALIKREDAGVSVAPISDKRPAVTMASEYEALPDAEPSRTPPETPVAESGSVTSTGNGPLPVEASVTTDFDVSQYA